MSRRRLVSLSLVVLALAAFAWANANVTIYMPIVAQAPSLTPTPTPTRTPTPTIVPTSPPMHTENGIRGDFFHIRNRVAGPNQDVWFDFGVTNVGSVRVDYGALGAWWSSGSQASWGDDDFFNPGQGIQFHEDHLNIPSTGTYQVRLAICFLPKRVDCQSQSGLSQWKFLSDPVSVTIQ
jgi:hypothetical protein